MKHLRRLGVVVFALCACAAVLAATASAVPLLQNLPSSTTRTYTSKALGGTKLTTLSGNSIECTAATDTSTETSSDPPKGEFHITFTGCGSEKPVKGLKCTGASPDASGVILVLGIWHLVFDTNPANTPLNTAILFLITEFDIKCTALVDIKIVGSLLCLHLNPTVKSLTHEFHCFQKNGDAEETQWWDGTGAGPKTALLLSSFGGGTFESSGQEGLATITGTEEIFADQ